MIALIIKILVVNLLSSIPSITMLLSHENSNLSSTFERERTIRTNLLVDEVSSCGIEIQLANTLGCPADVIEASVDTTGGVWSLSPSSGSQINQSGEIILGPNGTNTIIEDTVFYSIDGINPCIDTMLFSISPLPSAPTTVSPLHNDCPTTTVDLNDAVSMTEGGTLRFFDSNAIEVIDPTSAVAGTYTVYETNSVGCIGESSEIIVSIDDCSCNFISKIVITESRVEVCADTTATFNYVVENGLAFLSTTGNGSLDVTVLPIGVGTITYTPGPGDTEVDVVITAVISDLDGNGPCTGAEDTAIASFNPLPVVDTGGPFDQMCAGSENIMLSGNPSDPPGVWNGSGILDNEDGTAIFAPLGLSGNSPVGVFYSYVDEKGCTGSASSEIEVVANPVVPTIEPMVENICPSPTVNLVELLEMTEGGTISFKFTDDINGEDVPDPTKVGQGAYYIFETNEQGCVSSSAQVVVNTIGCICPTPPVVDIFEEFVDACALVPAFLGYSVENGPAIVFEDGFGNLQISLLPNGIGLIFYIPTIEDVGNVVKLVVEVPDSDGDGPCEAVRDSVLISVFNAASVTLDPMPASICENIVPFTINSTPNSPPGVFGIEAGLTDHGDGSATFDPKAAGVGIKNISVTYSDPNGCESTAGYEVEVKEAITLISVTKVDPFLCSEATGSITLNYEGGVEPVEISIDGGSTFIQDLDGGGTETFSGLSEGIYNIVARNADVDNYCPIPWTNTIELIAPIQIEETEVSFVNPSTCDGLEASITIVATGDQLKTLHYSIDNGVTFQSSNVFNDLSAGIYDEIVVAYTDGSCTLPINEVELIEPEIPTITMVTSQPESDCEANDGQIEIVSSGLGAEIGYSIDGGVSFIDGDPGMNSKIFDNLNPGIYNIQIAGSDGTCLSEIQQIEIEEKPMITINDIVLSNPSDCGASDGSIIVISSGGLDVMYSLNGETEQADNEFSDLSQGTYTITVINGDGTCSESDVVQLEDPNAPVITSVIKVDESSCGLGDGSIEILTAGGESQIEYSIDGVEWNDQSYYPNLNPDSYQVSVRNDDGTCVSLTEEIQIINGACNADTFEIIVRIDSTEILKVDSMETGPIDNIVVCSSPTSLGDIDGSTLLDGDGCFSYTAPSNSGIDTFCIIVTGDNGLVDTSVYIVTIPYSCEEIEAMGLDFCLILESNPDALEGTLDCDGDGFDFVEECNPDDGPPSDPDDPCSFPIPDGQTFCDVVLANPDFGIADLDCDGDGFTNIEECDPEDGPPSDPEDPCSVPIPDGQTLCELVLANPDFGIADLDCDGDGFTNIEECDPDDGLPSDPNDPCSNQYLDGDEICTAIGNGEADGLIGSDCDTGSIPDNVECFPDEGDPTDPTDPCDDLLPDGVTTCDVVMVEGNESLIGEADCDDGGLDNGTECIYDGDVFDPEDDCTIAEDNAIDICALIQEDPSNGFANSDCDGDGNTNMEECMPTNGSDPSDPFDPCDNQYPDSEAVCNFIFLNPISELANSDCDEGGIPNMVECIYGSDVNDPSDDIITVPDVNVTYIDVQVTGDLSTNDIFIPEGATYSGISILGTNPNSEIPVLEEDGSYTFISDLPGVYTFLVEIEFSEGNHTEELVITILDFESESNSPIVNADLGFTSMNVPVEFKSLFNDFSGNVNSILLPSTVDVIDIPNHGSFEIDENSGDITYTPDNGYFGLDTLRYSVSDDLGNTGSAIQIVLVIPSDLINTTSSSDDSFVTPINTNLIENVLTNDSDPEGHLQNAVEQNTMYPDKGMFSLAESGEFQFTPVSGYSGPVEFSYVVEDELGERSAATVYILVQKPKSAIEGFLWNDKNGNGIQDVGESGLANVLVRLTDNSGDGVAVTFTDANGEYDFQDGIIGEKYKVEVDLLGLDMKLTEKNVGQDDTVDSDLSEEQGVIRSSTFTLPLEEDVIIDGGFYECNSIGSLVWLDFNKNDLVDPFENGINGLKVRLYALIDGQYELVQSTKTGHKPDTPSSDGYFEFCAPSELTYYVEVLMPPIGLVQAIPNVGNDELLDSDLTNDNGFSTTSSFYLYDGVDKLDIGAGYYLMATAGNRVWEDINNNGIQDNGEPSVAGVQVEAFEVDTDEKVGESITNESGEYSIEYLQKKDYYLRFTPPEQYGFTIPNVGDDASDSDVNHYFGYKTTSPYSMNPGDNYINIDAGLTFGVLPLEWIYLDARNDEDENIISWMTTNEINTSYFEVQRGYENTSEFELVDIVQSKGKVTSNNVYEIKDKNLKSGKYYYRIKQVDIDGKFEFSPIVYANVKEDKNILKLSPNPTFDKSTLYIYLDQSESAKVSIFSVQGSLMRSIDLHSDGNDFIESSIRIEDLATGVYAIQVNQGSYSKTIKLVVMN